MTTYEHDPVSGWSNAMLRGYLHTYADSLLRASGGVETGHYQVLHEAANRLDGKRRSKQRHELDSVEVLDE